MKKSWLIDFLINAKFAKWLYVLTFFHSKDEAVKE